MVVRFTGGTFAEDVNALAAELALPFRAVRLDLIFRARDQRNGMFEVGDRAVKFANRQVAVAPVAIETRIVRVFADAFREHLDRTPVVTGVCNSAAEPDDVVRIIDHMLNNEKLSGPYNLVAPQPVTNYTFTKSLGRALHRPTISPLTSPAIFTTLAVTLALTLPDSAAASWAAFS